MKPNAIFAVCLAFAGALACGGCSMMLDDNSAVYSVAPGKYDYIDCKGIGLRADANVTRSVQLTKLMQLANQDPIGPFVSNMVYREEYNMVQADQQALRHAADEKRFAPEVMNPKPKPLNPMH